MNWLSPFILWQIQRRKILRTHYLLHRLEHLGIVSFANPGNKNYREKRKALRNQLITLGPDVRFTILKYSRHEGWDYRDDVYKVMSEMVPDITEFFIEGLSNPDPELRWSATKWLRDKAQGQTRAIPALIEYMRQFPFGGDADVALTTMGVAGNKALVELVLDSTARLESRTEAGYTFTRELLSANEIQQLLALVSNQDEDENLRLTIRGALDGQNQKWLTKQD